MHLSYGWGVSRDETYGEHQLKTLLVHRIVRMS
jgi:hypothetical protein